MRICFLVDSVSSVALPREPQQQSNRDAEPKGSQHKPSANIETDRSHHQETNRDKNSGKLRVHLHHAHNARVTIGVAVLHVVNCLTDRCGWPGLLISPCVDNTGAARRDLNPSDHKMAAPVNERYRLISPFGKSGDKNLIGTLQMSIRWCPLTKAILVSCGQPCVTISASNY